MDVSPSAHVDTFARDHQPPPDHLPDLLYTLPELHYPDALNCVAELVDATIARYGADRTALLGEGLAWTYGDLREQVARVARVLTDDLGVVPGNRVLLRGPNSPWLAACWLAIVSAGAIVVPVVPMLRSGELRTIAGIARVTHALCDVRSLNDLVKAEIPGLTITAFDGDGPAAADGRDVAELQRLAAAREPAFTPVATAADDICAIAFTSGTTGRPKGCMHTHRDMLAIADTFSAHVLKPRPDDVFIGSPPLSFTYGLGGSLIFPLRAGASSVLLARATPDALPAAIARYGVTVLFTAPTAYRALLAQPATDELRTLRRCVSAGEKLPKAVWEDWYRTYGVKIIDGIGATEMLHIFISAADDDIRPGATGVPVPGYEARVVDDDGTEVPDGVPGHLAVRGPTGCRYLDDPRQAEYVRGGWNHTGDTYIRDADGYFWYQARSDDMIISSGYNIAGPEVEEALLRHPDVVEAAVVGEPDDTRGQLVSAYVVLRDPALGSEEKKRELQDFAKREIAPYKYPRAVAFRETLPRTATGKLQRYRLRTGG